MHVEIIIRLSNADFCCWDAEFADFSIIISLYALVVGDSISE